MTSHTILVVLEHITFITGFVWIMYKAIVAWNYVDCNVNDAFMGIDYVKEHETLKRRTHIHIPCE